MLITSKQLQAIRLRRLGMTDGEVAALLGLKHRQSANRLINRGKRRLAELVALAPAELQDPAATTSRSCATAARGPACGGCLGIA